MEEVYICHTVYHLYITLLKVYEKKSVDVILVNTISNCNELAERLRKHYIFRNVICLDRKEYFGKNIQEYICNYTNYIVNHKNISLKLQFLKEYNNIYIYNDYSEMGIFLSKNNINYHLIEDGLDVFKQFDVYEEIGRHYHLKKLLYSLFRLPYSVGMTKQCVDVEINDENNLKTKLTKQYHVVNRKKLEEQIDANYRNLIFEVFGIKEIKMAQKKAIILTQVLEEILVVQNKREQYNFYANVISQYYKQYKIYIKPHPRDLVDYSGLIEEYDVECLDKNIPMEVYANLPGMHFDLAITYSSTAVNSGNIADKIIRLDKKV